MSTELKSRSKAYDLTRVSMGGGTVGVVVGLRIWNKPSITLSVGAIGLNFQTNDWSEVQNTLGLADESMVPLQLDLAQFAFTSGKGMEAY